MRRTTPAFALVRAAADSPAGSDSGTGISWSTKQPARPLSGQVPQPAAIFVRPACRDFAASDVSFKETGGFPARTKGDRQAARRDDPQRQNARTGRRVLDRARSGWCCRCAVAEGLTVAVPAAKYPFQSGHVELMGHRIHYVEHGAGAPVLFLHGNPTSG